MKFDQDLCLNLFKLWKAELNPRVRCAFGNVSLFGAVVGRTMNWLAEQEGASSNSFLFNR